MTKRRKECAIDLSWFMGASWLDGNQLDILQRLFLQHAPKWSSGLHLWRYRKPREGVQLENAGALKELVAGIAQQRGKLFNELKETAPPSSLPDRKFGSLELRGADDSLTAVLIFDDWVFVPLGNGWRFGNSVSIQIRLDKVEGKTSVDWTTSAFVEFCKEFAPFYGYGFCVEEYDAKNMFKEGGSIRALGQNIAKALPGIYWLNFFGKPYVELIGRERLRSAPAHLSAEANSGCIISLGNSPEQWNTPEYQEREKAVLKHVGEQYFFSRHDETRKTISPFHLPERTEDSNVQAYVDVTPNGEILVKRIKLTDR